MVVKLADGPTPEKLNKAHKPPRYLNSPIGRCLLLRLATPAGVGEPYPRISPDTGWAHKS